MARLIGSHVQVNRLVEADRRRCRRKVAALFLVKAKCITADGTFNCGQPDDFFNRAAADDRICFRDVVNEQNTFRPVIAAEFKRDGRTLNAVLFRTLNRQHAVDGRVSAAFPGHDQAVGSKVLRQFDHHVRTSRLVPVRRIVTAAEYDAAEVQVFAVPAVEFAHDGMVDVSVSRHLVQRPRQIVADHCTVQHLIRMEDGRHDFINRHTVQQCIRIHALILALPDQHYIRQIRIDLINRIRFASVRLLIECQFGEAQRNFYADRADLLIVFVARFALMQLVRDDQIDRFIKRRHFGDRAGHLHDRIARIQKTAARTALLPGQGTALHNAEPLQHIRLAASDHHRITEVSRVDLSVSRPLDHGGERIEQVDDARVFARLHQFKINARNMLQQPLYFFPKLILADRENAVGQLCRTAEFRIPDVEIVSLQYFIHLHMHYASSTL